MHKVLQVRFSLFKISNTSSVMNLIFTSPSISPKLDELHLLDQDLAYTSHVKSYDKYYCS